MVPPPSVVVVVVLEVEVSPDKYFSDRKAGSVVSALALLEFSAGDAWHARRRNARKTPYAA
jgi:hypothetical protein